MSVCVDAGVWQNYKRGVLTRTCKQQLDHCVQAGPQHHWTTITAPSLHNCCIITAPSLHQAVGYSQSGNKPYWIVRNSWNTDWGIKGYVYVGMGGDYCGIANEATIVQV